MSLETLELVPSPKKLIPAPTVNFSINPPRYFSNLPKRGFDQSFTNDTVATSIAPTEAWWEYVDLSGTVSDEEVVDLWGREILFPSWDMLRRRLAWQHSL